ncbi:hypothetical protein V8C40DRAFT_238665 [Trichoderma camerunense]
MMPSRHKGTKNKDGSVFSRNPNVVFHKERRRSQSRQHRGFLQYSYQRPASKDWGGRILDNLYSSIRSSDSVLRQGLDEWPHGRT